MLRLGLVDFRITALTPKRTREVRALRTSRAMQEHATSQGNCAGDVPVLAKVARGEMVLFEVSQDGRTYTASAVPCGRLWKVGEVEGPAGGKVVGALFKRVAAAVAAAVGPRIKPPA